MGCWQSGLVLQGWAKSDLILRSGSTYAMRCCIAKVVTDLHGRVSILLDCRRKKEEIAGCERLFERRGDFVDDGDVGVAHPEGRGGV